MTMGDRIKRKTPDYVDELDGDPHPLGQPLSAPPQTQEKNPSPRRLTGPGPFLARSTQP